jgi:hypothetical protein
MIRTPSPLPSTERSHNFQLEMTNAGSHRTFLLKNKIRLPCLSGAVLMVYIRQMAIKKNKCHFIAKHSCEKGV